MALATVAGVTAIGAYLDAKFHIRKDLRSLYNLRAGARQFVNANAANRMSLWYPFEAQVERMPVSEECLWSRDGRYTWRETHAHACRYAQFLQAHGAQPGELVAFDMQNSAEFVLCLLSTWAIGTAPAFINYNLAGEALLHCLKTSGAKLLLVDEDDAIRTRVEDVRERIEKELGMEIVVLDRATKAHIAGLEPTRPGDELRANVKGPDPMMLVFTSGTTGFPKAVPFHIERAWGSVGTRIRTIGVEPGPNGDRWYDPMPMYHGTGGNVAVFCLTSGITLCIGKKFSARGFWDDIRASDSTAFVYVGETARYLLAAPPSSRDRDHRVRLMFGNGLRPDVWLRFQERFGVSVISEFFNSSEGVFGLINVCKGEFTAGAVGHHGGLLRYLTRNTHIPVAIDHVTNDIARHPSPTSPSHAFATRLPYTVGGEMLVAVPSAAASGFAGYWRNPSATAKKFTSDVFKPGDLYYRSGDALRRDDDGRWYFLDRLGDTFRWKGENVSTAEVAVVLGGFPGVVEANVYGVSLPGHDGRAGCAALYIPPEARQGFDYAGLLKYARARLPRYAVPVFLRLVAEMSPMHNNKQNKVPLREEGVEIAKVMVGVSPTDRLLWCPPGGEGYVEFGEREWGLLVSEKAKL